MRSSFKLSWWSYSRRVIVVNLATTGLFASRSGCQRLLEMCIHQKIDVIFDEFTPECQTGDVKIVDTIEPLSLLMSTLLEKSAMNDGMINTFADIEKCFDNIYLNDSNFFLLIN